MIEVGAGEGEADAGAAGELVGGGEQREFDPGGLAGDERAGFGATEGARGGRGRGVDQAELALGDVEDAAVGELGLEVGEQRAVVAVAAQRYAEDGWRNYSGFAWKFVAAIEGIFTPF